MTSNTVPNGIVSSSDGRADAYKVFNWENALNQSFNFNDRTLTANAYIRYMFDSPVKIENVECGFCLQYNILDPYYFVIQACINGEWVTISDTETITPNGASIVPFIMNIKDKKSYVTGIQLKFTGGTTYLHQTNSHLLLVHFIKVFGYTL